MIPFFFGNYWQEDTNGNGVADTNDNKTPIKWQVIDKQDNKALLLSDKLIETYYFCKKSKYTDWDDSDIREWMNNTLYNDLFNESEKLGIIESDINNTTIFGVEKESTKDKLFLPSASEVTNTDYGFSSDKRCYDQARQAIYSDFAIQTAWKKADYVSSINLGSCWRGDYWLRTSIEDFSTSCFAASVKYNGNITDYDNDGEELKYEYCGIRPMLWVDLSKVSLEESNPVEIGIKGCKWDTVVFGEFGGYPLKWRVLNISGDDAFLVSDCTLCMKDNGTILYDSENGEDWSESELREWLNSTFYANAFSKDEKEMIVPTWIKNDYICRYDEDEPYDINTYDAVAILSFLDTTNNSYGFPSAYYCQSETKKAKKYNGDSSSYYLRFNCVGIEYAASYIDENGYDDSLYLDLRNETADVRPTLHIDLSKKAWIKGEPVTVGDAEGGIIIPFEREVVNPSYTPTPIVYKEPTSEPTPESTPTAVPTITPTVKPTDGAPSIQPSATPSIVKDNKTSFSIKNKAKVKKNSKIKIKDKDKIKKVTLNGKTVKIKKNKTSFTLKLKSYKKKLKKKGKWNTLKVTDNKGNVKTIKFKIK